MSDLHIPLKREYFDQIRAGIKPEEYRLCNAYWEKRLKDRAYDNIVLTMGYPKKDDQSRRLVLPYRGYKVKSILHPHFGNDLVMVYAIDVSQKDQQADKGGA